MPPPRWRGAPWSWRVPPLRDHAAPEGLSVLPVRGLPDFRPGDDLAGALAAAAPWLEDGDVVVVTSKVFSKTEGRQIGRAHV